MGLKNFTPAELKAMMYTIALVFGEIETQDDSGVVLATPFIGGLCVRFDTGGKAGTVSDRGLGMVLSSGARYTTVAAEPGWQKRFNALYDPAFLRLPYKRYWAGFMSLYSVLPLSFVVGVTPPMECLVATDIVYRRDN